MEDLTPDYTIIPMKERVVLPEETDVFGESFGGLSGNATSVQQGSGDNIFKISEKGIHLGDAEFEDAPFSVTMAGAIVAIGLTVTSASIGGFDVGSDYIRDTANSFGLASTVTGSDDVRFWAGATFANRSTAPFRVTEAGVVTSSSSSTAISSATITAGTIQTATSGQRIRLVSASAVSPTQGANSLALVNSSDSTILDFGSNASIIMRILPTNDDHQALVIQNAAGLAVTLTQFSVDVQNSSSTGQSILAQNAGSGAAGNFVQTNTGKAIIITKSGTANTALDISQSTSGAAIAVTSSAGGHGFSVNYSSTSTTNQAIDVTYAGQGRVISFVQSNATTNPNPIVYMSQALVVSTHFKRYFSLDGAVTIWKSDGTTPNGNLTGDNTGDICFGADSGKAYYCTGTTNWTAL